MPKSSIKDIDAMKRNGILSYRHKESRCLVKNGVGTRYRSPQSIPLKEKVGWYGFSPLFGSTLMSDVLKGGLCEVCFVLLRTKFFVFMHRQNKGEENNAYT